MFKRLTLAALELFDAHRKAPTSTKKPRPMSAADHAAIERAAKKRARRATRKGRDE